MKSRTVYSVGEAIRLREQRREQLMQELADEAQRLRLGYEKREGWEGGR